MGRHARGDRGMALVGFSRGRWPPASDREGAATHYQWLVCAAIGNLRLSAYGVAPEEAIGLLSLGSDPDMRGSILLRRWENRPLVSAMIPRAVSAGRIRAERPS